jgi:hypothetical protein
MLEDLTLVVPEAAINCIAVPPHYHVAVVI